MLLSETLTFGEITLRFYRLFISQKPFILSKEISGYTEKLYCNHDGFRHTTPGKYIWNKNSKINYNNRIFESDCKVM